MATYDKAHYIQRARAQKALHLADYLQRQGIDVATVRSLNDAGKRSAEAHAGVHSPASGDTWAVVIAILDRRAAQRAHVLDPELVDA